MKVIKEMQKKVMSVAANVPGRAWCIAIAVSALAVMGCVYLARCVALAADPLGLEGLRLRHQLAWNAIGVCLASTMLVAGWRRILKTVPYVLGVWLCLLAAAYFCPRVNGGLRVGLGAVSLDVIACFPLMASLAIAWLADWFARRFKSGTWMFINGVVAGAVVLLAVVVLSSPEKRARLAEYFGNGASQPVAEEQRTNPGRRLQGECVRAFHAAHWFSPNEEALRPRELPVRFFATAPANSALMFGKWFPALGAAFFGLFALALVHCWWKSGGKAERVFAISSGVFILFPAVHGFCGCLGFGPLIPLGVPLLSYGGEAAATAWILAGVLAAIASSSRVGS